MIDSGSLAESISELNAERALDQVKAKISRSEDPAAILAECRRGMDDVGRRFETSEYFIADLMYGASIFQDIMSLLRPELKRSVSAQAAGKVTIATVKDDVHDVGKNLVAAMLDAAGFEVTDLGVDVSADAILDDIERRGPHIVALSCLLTTTVDSMEEIISRIARGGLRDQVKVIVGGIPLSPELARSMGADAYGDNAHEAVLRCRELMEARSDGR